ncbi:MAG: phosphoadenylyl-sulfate reductase [Proteobacteria bacterium]|nr:phosphoadenylyl-sulfate reductase [Pseudomonadota bacterium]NOG61718.1 phosphoadenylyl-sulfate reductase [Pseudomonadota bacterium]
MSAPEFNLEKLATEYEDRSPVAIIKMALENFNNIAISFSGAEDVILIDIASKINPDINVFSLDTGRLHAETYRFIEQVREHYGIKIEALSPDAESIQKLVKEKGLYSFYKDGHKECCGIRKVIPLRRKLMNLDAWITGQRKDQSPDTRNAVPVIERDAAFSTSEKELIKFNPLSNWTSTDIWEYIRNNDVPFNALHQQGFISIGCEPCTRAVLPNQHEREGRWWWEEATQKECGLHEGNLKK